MDPEGQYQLKVADFYILYYCAYHLLIRPNVANSNASSLAARRGTQLLIRCKDESFNYDHWDSMLRGARDLDYWMSKKTITFTGEACKNFAFLYGYDPTGREFPRVMETENLD